MLNKNTIQPILDKYQLVKLHQSTTPVLLSGYRSLLKPFKYKYRSSIISIISARSYYTKRSKLMSDVIKKAISNPQPLKK